MENVVFYAKAKKDSSAIVGKAVRLTQISVDKKLSDVQIDIAFFPLSQLQIDVVKKDFDTEHALVECRCPLWLWDAKCESDGTFNSKISDAFHQLTMLTSDDNPSIKGEHI